MPKSCIDLQYICKHRKRFIRAGWKIVYLPPWYLIMRTEKVETVFCDFTLTQSCPSTILRPNLGKILSFSIVSAFPVVMDGPRIFWRWRILYFGVYSVDVDLPTQRQIKLRQYVYTRAFLCTMSCALCIMHYTLCINKHSPSTLEYWTRTFHMKTWNGAWRVFKLTLYCREQSPIHLNFHSVSSYTLISGFKLNNKM